MSFDLETIYRLLPAVYRIRDTEQGEPLRALLAVIAEQAAVLEEDLDQLYDDMFIETCAEWVVPYIGDLIGAHGVHELADAALSVATLGRLSSRAQVANTLSYRRRKGTAAVLEQLAADVTGWKAHAVEFFQLLATTQYLNHLRPDARVTPDLRRWDALERVGTAFDSLARTADMRRIVSGRGRYNLPNVGVFVWRINSYPLTDSPASVVDNDRRFRFSPLGCDIQLYGRPEPEDDLAGLAEPRNLPLPIGRRQLDADIAAARNASRASSDFYGPGLSLLISVAGQPVAIEQISICDLSDEQPGQAESPWAHMPAEGVAIDPALGRMAFGQKPAGAVRVSFHYGFAADLGGGEYERPTVLIPAVGVPAPETTIAAGLTALPAAGGAVEIDGSGRYEETLMIDAAGRAIALQAGPSARPTLILGGELVIGGDQGATVTLDGLLIAGARLVVPAQIAGRANRLRRLVLRHCTLVPGLTLDPGGVPIQPEQPSLSIEIGGLELMIERCIVGALRIHEAATVTIDGSVVDATAADLPAYAAVDGVAAGGALTMTNSTVVGKLHAVALDLVSNSIIVARLKPEDGWAAPVLADRRQRGCVRFSSLPPGALVPRRYRCLPGDGDDPASVRPQFSSLRCCDPNYARLSRACPAAVRQGADDGSEMGAYHDLFEPQREANLRTRLDEYLRFGLEAGILFAS